MFMLFDGSYMADIYYDSLENLCIQKAVNDLQKDIYRVSGRKANINQFLPSEYYNLIIGTLQNDRFMDFIKKNRIDVSEMEDKWENYTICTFGENNCSLLIVGSDMRGTMWGIYEFSKQFLDIDPLYLWTDHMPRKKAEVVIPEMCIMDGPQTFKFRGWFVNDEDLLEGFCKGGVPEKGYCFHDNYAKPLETLVETGLRLKQNLLIPCSHIDIENPVDAELVRIVTERGMYISMHHQEPVGVHQFTIDRYWKEHGIEDINYFEYKEKYEELWRKYIRKWSQYDNVIWQLGLRGRGDRPVWYNAAGIPRSIQERGELISDAIQKQYDIIKEENPGKNILSSSTLWMEGMGLYKENALTFPKATMVVFADFAPEQMWGEGYYTVPREGIRDYGLYYHVGFWGCGPHLVQGNQPEKIYFNYKDAVAKGDNYYSILNVANFREFVYNIKCVADITWDIDRFDVNRFRKEWCEREFKAEDATELMDIYEEYYRCFYEMDATMISGQMLFMDGMSRRVALKLMEIIRGSELKQVDIQNTRLFDFGSTDEFITYYLEATKIGNKRFKKLYHRAVTALASIPKERQQFFISNMIVQTEIILGLYSWVHSLCLAAKDRRTDANDGKYEAYIDEALFALAQISMDRKKAATGKWAHWYDGDTLINIAEDIVLTKELHIGSEKKSQEIDIFNSKY